MKTSKVELIRWLPEHGENIEINWPKVHRAIGSDQVRWLIDQDHTHCQLVLERRDLYCRLVAEFYNEQTFLAYNLMWAK